MSLYWQQAVQNRGATESQNHANSDNPQQERLWHDIKLTHNQTSTWNHETTNQPAQNYAHDHMQNENSHQYSGYDAAYQHNHAPTANIHHDSGSVQHTPILNTCPARNTLQEYPVVSLPSVEEQVKTSSQVTPESTYSVDTFNSHNSKEEKKNEFEDWEQTPNDAFQQVAQSETSQSTSAKQSKNKALEGEHQTKNRNNTAINSEPKKFKEIQEITKYPKMDHSTAPVRLSYAAPSPVEDVILAPSTNVHVHVELRQEQIDTPLDNSLFVTDIRGHTPETQNLRIDNIGAAQATSTPNDTVEEHERQLERRTSVSSVRSGFPQPTSTNTQNGENSDSTQGSATFTRGAVRASYQERFKGVKEKYLDSRSDASQVMRKLEKLRTNTPKMVRSNPLHDISGRRSALQITSKNKMDTSSPAYLLLDKGNISNYSQPDPALNDSIDISTNGAGYGEDFVETSRRSRLNRSRPASRARSDIGEEINYHRGSAQYHGRQFDRGYPVPPHNFPYQAVGRNGGRMSAAANPYQNDYYNYQQNMSYHRPRPQSTYDQRAMDRYQRTGSLVNYDVYASRQEDDDESVSDESEVLSEAAESEDEMRTYNMAPRGINHSFSNYSVNSHQRRQTVPYGPQELYLFGVVRLDTKMVDNIFRRMNVPREYYTVLEPVEKVAYLYFATVYNKLYTKGVQNFQNVFKREYFKYICENIPANEALLKICTSMYKEKLARNSNTQQQAYQASQKQLFSDDRESADGLSDRASVNERDEDHASDIMSDVQRAPLKYRTPHAFLKFGPGGKKITVNPDNSVSVVYIDDVKNILNDNHSRRIVDAAQNFKGPLDPARTQPHSVTLYIQNQIRKICSSEVAHENPNNCDVIDCLLLWRLLEMVVQQRGHVSGPDIARLLNNVQIQPYSKKNTSNHREKSTTPSLESMKSVPMDPKAYEKFTGYLLGGHIDQAVDCAVNNGLYADAMVLVRKIFGGDEKKIADVESRFLATRPSSNPFMTLIAVASNLPAPCLTNPTIDDAGVWRSHAAIVLANLNTAHAKETVYKLGCVLHKREYNAAADFCFLSVALLSNFEGLNVFQKLPMTEENSDCQYVSLIHASLPDDDLDSTTCRFGFSLTDLHATEIFDYAVKLNTNFTSPLERSVDFQRRRLQYGHLLAGLGGFNAEAYRYLTNVKSSIWNYCNEFSIVELSSMTDLADSLRMFADDDTRWIETLREWISQQAVVANHSAANQPQQNQVFEEPTSNVSQEPTTFDSESHAYAHHQPDPPKIEEINPILSRSRTDSLAQDARDWHADRQDPIQMSPRVSTASPDFRRDSVNADVFSQTGDSSSQYQTPNSITSAEFKQEHSYREPVYEEQQQISPRSYSDNYSETESPESTSHESTPVRNVPSATNAAQNAQYAQLRWEPTVEPQSYATTHSAPPTATPQPPTNQATKEQSSLQSSSLKKTNNSSGMLSWIGSKVRQAVPGNTEMRLPDDRNPAIRWDANLNKWVGDGTEAEEAFVEPPPSIPTSYPVSTTNGAMTGLRAVRGTGGSRYCNPLANNSSTGSAPSVPVMTSAMPMVAFNFIPQMPDDVDVVDPFSGEPNPTVHNGADQAAHEQN